jgi:diguanylate cyclase (GGDEF)-like protein
MSAESDAAAAAERRRAAEEAERRRREEEERRRKAEELARQIAEAKRLAAEAARKAAEHARAEAAKRAAEAQKHSEHKVVAHGDGMHGDHLLKHDKNLATMTLEQRKEHATNKPEDYHKKNEPHDKVKLSEHNPDSHRDQQKKDSLSFEVKGQKAIIKDSSGKVVAEIEGDAHHKLNYDAEKKQLTVSSDVKNGNHDDKLETVYSAEGSKRETLKSKDGLPLVSTKTDKAFSEKPQVTESTAFSYLDKHGKAVDRPSLQDKSQIVTAITLDSAGRQTRQESFASLVAVKDAKPSLVQETAYSFDFVKHKGTETSVLTDMTKNPPAKALTSEVTTDFRTHAKEVKIAGENMQQTVKFSPDGKVESMQRTESGVTYDFCVKNGQLAGVKKNGRDLDGKERESALTNGDLALALTKRSLSDGSTVDDTQMLLRSKNTSDRTLELLKPTEPRTGETPTGSLIIKTDNQYHEYKIKDGNVLGPDNKPVGRMDDHGVIKFEGPPPVMHNISQSEGSMFRGIGTDKQSLVLVHDQQQKKDFTGTIQSPDRKTEYTVVNGFVLDKDGNFYAHMNRSGLLEFNGKNPASNADVSTRFKGWTLQGSEDGHERTVTISNRSASGEMHIPDQKTGKPVDYEVRMGMLINKKTSEQIGIIDPPAERQGGGLEGGRVLFMDRQPPKVVNLEDLQNTVFKLHLHGQSTENREIEGIALGKPKLQADGSPYPGSGGLLNLQDVRDVESSRVKAAEQKVHGQEDMNVFFKMSDALVQRNYDKLKQDSESAQKAADATNKAIDDMLATGRVNPETLSRLRKETSVQEALSTAETPQNYQKLKLDGWQPTMESLPKDTSTMQGKTMIAVPDGHGQQKMQEMQIKNGVLYAEDNKTQFARIINENGVAQLKLIHPVEGQPDKINMKDMAGATWNLSWDKEGGGKENVTWVSLGQNGMRSISNLRAEAIRESGYWQSLSGDSDAAKEKLAQINRREQEYEKHLAEIAHRGVLDPQKDLAFLLSTPSQFIRNETPEHKTVSRPEIKSAEDAQKVNGDMRVDNHVYEIKNGAIYSVDVVGGHRQVSEKPVGQLGPNYLVQLDGQGIVNLNEQNRVLLDVTVGDKHERHRLIGTGPAGVSRENGYQSGGLVDVEDLNRQARGDIAAAERSRLDYMGNRSAFSAVLDNNISGFDRSLENSVESVERDHKILNRSMNSLFDNAFDPSKVDSNRIDGQVRLTQTLMHSMGLTTAETAQDSTQYTQTQKMMTDSAVMAALTVGTAGLGTVWATAANAYKLSAATAMIGEASSVAVFSGTTSALLKHSENSSIGADFSDGAIKGLTMWGGGAICKQVGEFGQLGQIKQLQQLESAGALLTKAEGQVLETALAKAVQNGLPDWQVFGIYALSKAGNAALQTTGFAAADAVQSGSLDGMRIDNLKEGTAWMLLGELGGHGLNKAFSGAMNGLDEVVTAQLRRQMINSEENLRTLTESQLLGVSLLGKFDEHGVAGSLVRDIGNGYVNASSAAMFEQIREQKREIAQKMGLSPEDADLIDADLLRKNIDWDKVLKGMHEQGLNSAVQSAAMSPAGHFGGHFGSAAIEHSVQEHIPQFTESAYRNAAELFRQSNPEFARQYESYSPSQKQEFIEALAKNPETDRLLQGVNDSHREILMQQLKENPGLAGNHDELKGRSKTLLSDSLAKAGFDSVLTSALSSVSPTTISDSTAGQSSIKNQAQGQNLIDSQSAGDKRRLEQTSDSAMAKDLLGKLGDITKEAPQRLEAADFYSQLLNEKKAQLPVQEIKQSNQSDVLARQSSGFFDEMFERTSQVQTKAIDSAIVSSKRSSEPDFFDAAPESVQPGKWISDKQILSAFEQEIRLSRSPDAVRDPLDAGMHRVEWNNSEDVFSFHKTTTGESQRIRVVQDSAFEGENNKFQSKVLAQTALSELGVSPQITKWGQTVDGLPFIVEKTVPGVRLTELSASELTASQLEGVQKSLSDVYHTLKDAHVSIENLEPSNFKVDLAANPVKTYIVEPSAIAYDGNNAKLEQTFLKLQEKMKSPEATTPTATHTKVPAANERDVEELAQLFDSMNSSRETGYSVTRISEGNYKDETLKPEFRGKTTKEIAELVLATENGLQTKTFTNKFLDETTVHSLDIDLQVGNKNLTVRTNITPFTEFIEFAGKNPKIALPLLEKMTTGWQEYASNVPHVLDAVVSQTDPIPGRGGDLLHEIRIQSEFNPQDPLHLAENLSRDSNNRFSGTNNFRSSATAERTGGIFDDEARGIVRVYPAEMAPYVLSHEVSRLFEESSSYFTSFKRARELEEALDGIFDRQLYVKRPYARYNESEDWAVHLGETFVYEPDETLFRAFVDNATTKDNLAGMPKLLVATRALNEWVSNERALVSPEDHRALETLDRLAKRVEFAESKLKEPTLKLIEATITSTNPAVTAQMRGAAVDLLVQLNPEGASGKISQALITISDIALPEPEKRTLQDRMVGMLQQERGDKILFPLLVRQPDLAGSILPLVAQSADPILHKQFLDRCIKGNLEPSLRSLEPEKQQQALASFMTRANSEEIDSVLQYVRKTNESVTPEQLNSLIIDAAASTGSDAQSLDLLRRIVPDQLSDHSVEELKTMVAFDYPGPLSVARAKELLGNFTEQELSQQPQSNEEQRKHFKPIMEDLPGEVEKTAVEIQQTFARNEQNKLLDSKGNLLDSEWPAIRPENLALVKDKVSDELAQIKASAGESVLDKLQNSSLSAEQRDRVLSALSEVREHYARSFDSDMDQVVNWIHTQGELGRVLDSAKAAHLTAGETEDALLASMFSDSLKNKSNFTTHHLDGAVAALNILKDRVGGEFTQARLDGILHAIQEHQIAPPAFMAMIYGGGIRRSIAQEGRQLTPDENSALTSLLGKISSPFNQPTEQTAGGGRAIQLTADERALLKRTGCDDWYVPTEGTPWYKASRALIDGDGIDNYATPGGLSKIIQIRGPESGPFFKDANIRYDIPERAAGQPTSSSQQSWKDSFNDFATVASPEGLRIANHALSKAESDAVRAQQRVDEWLRQKLDLPADAQLPTIPGWTGKPLLDELNRPVLDQTGKAVIQPDKLKYPEYEQKWWDIHNKPAGKRTPDETAYYENPENRYRGLHENEIADFKLAQQIRDRYADELRKEQRVQGDAAPVYKPTMAGEQERVSPTVQKAVFDYQVSTLARIMDEYERALRGVPLDQTVQLASDRSGKPVDRMDQNKGNKQDIVAIMQKLMDSTHTLNDLQIDEGSASIHPVIQREILGAKVEALSLAQSMAEDSYNAVSRDFLTGLPNKQALEEHLRSEIARAERAQDPADVTVFFCDFRNFKAVNDSYGHNVGDQTIKYMSEKFSSLIRQQAMAGRYGGDELVAIERGLAPEALQALADRLKDTRIAVSVSRDHQGEVTAHFRDLLTNEYAKAGEIEVGLYVGKQKREPGMSAESMLALADRDMLIEKNRIKQNNEPIPEVGQIKHHFESDQSHVDSPSAADQRSYDWVLKTLVSQSQILDEQANRDQLTGLYNRRYLNEHMDRILAKALRDEAAGQTASPLTYLALDGDGLRRINNVFGHKMGDELLRTIAQEISRVKRYADIPAHTGGDEFALALSGSNNPQRIVEALQDIRLAVSKDGVRRLQPDEKLSAGELLSGISVGAATRLPGENIAQIKERAEQSLIDDKSKREAEGRRIPRDAQTSPVDRDNIMRYADSLPDEMRQQYLDRNLPRDTHFVSPHPPGDELSNSSSANAPESSGEQSSERRRSRSEGRGFGFGKGDIREREDAKNRSGLEFTEATTQARVENNRLTDQIAAVTPGHKDLESLLSKGSAPDVVRLRLAALSSEQLNSLAPSVVFGAMGHAGLTRDAVDVTGNLSSYVRSHQAEALQTLSSMNPVNQNSAFVNLARQVIPHIEKRTLDAVRESWSPERNNLVAQVQSYESGLRSPTRDPLAAAEAVIAHVRAITKNPTLASASETDHLGRQIATIAPEPGALQKLLLNDHREVRSLALTMMTERQLDAVPFKVVAESLSRTSHDGIFSLHLATQGLYHYLRAHRQDAERYAATIAVNKNNAFETHNFIRNTLSFMSDDGGVAALKQWKRAITSEADKKLAKIMNGEMISSIEELQTRRSEQEKSKKKYDDEADAMQQGKLHRLALKPADQFYTPEGGLKTPLKLPGSTERSRDVPVFDYTRDTNFPGAAAYGDTDFRGEITATLVSGLLAAKGADYNGAIHLTAKANDTRAPKVIDYLKKVFPDSRIVVFTPPSDISQNLSVNPKAGAQQYREEFMNLYRHQPQRNGEVVQDMVAATNAYAQAVLRDPGVVERVAAAMRAPVTEEGKAHVLDYLGTRPDAETLGLLKPEVPKAIIFVRNIPGEARNMTPQLLDQIVNELPKGVVPIIMGDRLPNYQIPRNAVDMTEFFREVPRLEDQAYMFHLMGETGTRNAIGLMSASMDTIKFTSAINTIQFGPDNRLGALRNALGRERYDLVPLGKSDPYNMYPKDWYDSSDPQRQALAEPALQKFRESLQLQFANAKERESNHNIPKNIIGSNDGSIVAKSEKLQEFQRETRSEADPLALQNLVKEYTKDSNTHDALTMLGSLDAGKLNVLNRQDVARMLGRATADDITALPSEQGVKLTRYVRDTLERATSNFSRDNEIGLWHDIARNLVHLADTDSLSRTSGKWFLAIRRDETQSASDKLAMYADLLGSLRQSAASERLPQMIKNIEQECLSKLQSGADIPQDPKAIRALQDVFAMLAPDRQDTLEARSARRLAEYIKEQRKYGIEPGEDDLGLKLKPAGEDTIFKSPKVQQDSTDAASENRRVSRTPQETGFVGEYLIKNHLEKQSNVFDVRWTSQSEKLGWDLTYKTLDHSGQEVVHHAEVKSTSADKFSSFSMTDKEWQTAREMSKQKRDHDARDVYEVWLVANVLKEPEFAVIDPVSMVQESKLDRSASQFSVRINPELIADERQVPFSRPLIRALQDKYLGQPEESTITHRKVKAADLDPNTRQGLAWYVSQTLEKLPPTANLRDALNNAKALSDMTAHAAEFRRSAGIGGRDVSEETVNALARGLVDRYGADLRHMSRDDIEQALQVLQKQTIDRPVEKYPADRIGQMGEALAAKIIPTFYTGANVEIETPGLDHKHTGYDIRVSSPAGKVESNIDDRWEVKATAKGLNSPDGRNVFSLTERELAAALLHGENYKILQVLNVAERIPTYRVVNGNPIDAGALQDGTITASEHLFTLPSTARKHGRLLAEFSEKEQAAQLLARFEQLLQLKDQPGAQSEAYTDTMLQLLHQFE